MTQIYIKKSNSTNKYIRSCLNLFTNLKNYKVVKAIEDAYGVKVAGKTEDQPSLQADARAVRS